MELKWKDGTEWPSKRRQTIHRRLMKAKRPLNFRAAVAHFFQRAAFAIARLRSANKSGPVSIYNLTIRSASFSLSLSLSLSGSHMQPTTSLRFSQRIYWPIFVIIEQPRVPLARWPSRTEQRLVGERRTEKLRIIYPTTDQLNIVCACSPVKISLLHSCLVFLTLNCFNLSYRFEEVRGDFPFADS